MDEQSLFQTTNRPDNNPEQDKSVSSSKKEDSSDIKNLIRPEIFPTLSYTELFSLLKKCTRDDNVYFDESTKTTIPILIEELWKRKGVAFFDKFLIIQELQEVATHYSVGDGLEPSEEGCIDSLKAIAEQENNFFLRSTVTLFSSETHHNYSLEERYGMIQGHWKYLSPLFENGATHFHTDVRDYSIPGEVLSAHAIPEEIVRDITNWWIHEDREYFTEHEEQDLLQRKHLIDTNLLDALPSHLLAETVPQDIPITDCYRFERLESNYFPSAISAEYGALYNGLNLATLYPRSELKKSTLTLSDIQSIGRFLVELKQARPSTFLKSIGDTQATLPEVPAALQRNPRLLEKIQRYADDIISHRKVFEYDRSLVAPTSLLLPYSERKFGPEYDDALRASHLQGHEVVTLEDGSNAFDVIYKETLSWLHKELARSVTSSSSIEDVLRTELPKINKEDLTRLSVLYKSFSSTRMRVFLEDYFGFSYASIPLRAQLQFINYVHDKSIEDIQAVQSFIQHAGSPTSKSHRFIVFLSLENEITPEVFYRLDASLTPTLADQVFAKYAELVTAGNSVDSLLRDILPVDKATDGASNEIVKKLQKKGSDFLTELATTKHQDADIIFDTLTALRADLELFKTTFKTLREHGTDITLEDFRDSSFSNVHGVELPAVEVSRMRALYADSMQGYPQATKEELLADFDQHIDDEKSRFSLLRYKGEIAGFLCFTEKKPGQKYVSAVTLDPRFQKAYIGEAMIDEAFAREASENILGADCVAQKSVSARYIENGFIGVHSWDDRGDLILDIVRDDRRNEKYFSTKSLSQEEIVKFAPLGSIGTARIETIADPKNHNFTLCNKEFVLTRYFRNKHTGKWYLVYEPKPTIVSRNENLQLEEAVTA